MSLVHGEGEHWAAMFSPGGFCPCGCGKTGSRLSLKTGHIVKDCGCAPCRGGRNQRKGKRGQAKTHAALGGSGFTPYHEESGLFYDLTVRPEVKAGAQVPSSLAKFLATDWFRRALSQSERSIPVGIDARPAVSIDGRWLIVDLKRPNRDTPR